MHINKNILWKEAGLLMTQGEGCATFFGLFHEFSNKMCDNSMIQISNMEKEKLCQVSDLLDLSLVF